MNPILLKIALQLAFDKIKKKMVEHELLDIFTINNSSSIYSTNAPKMNSSIESIFAPDHLQTFKDSKINHMKPAAPCHLY